MTLDEVRRRIEPEKAALQARGVSALYVFGSVSRGEAEPESDVDLFLDIEPGRSFSILDLVDVTGRLTETLGRPADLHLRPSLHWRIRDDVQAEAVRLF